MADASGACPGSTEVADAADEETRLLLADTCEQLGHQAASGLWRGFHLAGATELRHGVWDVATPDTARSGTGGSMSFGLFLDAIAIRLNGLAVATVAGIIDLTVHRDGCSLDVPGEDVGDS